MAEKIISPGVFTNEIDQTFLPAAVADIGAVLIGPTQKGPAGVPTVVTSFSDFQAKFGDAFNAGVNDKTAKVQFLTSHAAEEYLKNSDTLTVVRVMADGTQGVSRATAAITASMTAVVAAAGSITASAVVSSSFTLETLADGSIMNNQQGSAAAGINGINTSGSKHNVRYEISSVNNNKGTFTLLIRAGNDSHKRKQILETFNNCSLDPNSTNYISKVVGDQRFNLKTDGTTKFLSITGSYPNASRFVRVSAVTTPTIDFLDENGNIRESGVLNKGRGIGNIITGSLPAVGSGSVNGGFSGGTDGHFGFDALGNMNGDSTATNVTTASAGGGMANFYEDIAGSDSQGFDPTTAADGLDAYTNALDLIANQDEYDVNLVLLPGIIGSLHTSVVSKAIDVCEDRGDCFAIIDPVPYNSTVTAATTQAATRDSNFAAMYWPWIKVPDTQVAGTQRWVPPSVVMGGIYAFNDKVAHPWFAPAGLNRGGITSAIMAERKLTQGNRDDLYDSNVNPIATFPGQGVTVFGQKTLQKKASALDRINVRRLLIRVKKFVASSSRFLVFEQNTAATRRRFLGIVNPFLEQVQAQSGLSAFRVVMDETNNTPDTIDRNQLIGQLFLQPTRTAEFIVLDFTIQPTGASFPE